MSTASPFTVSTFAGSTIGTDDGTGTAAQFGSFNYIYNIAVDSSNNLFVTDGNRIRKVTPGAVVTAFYNAAGDRANLNNPSNIAIDSADTLYVVDRNNHRIRKITKDGTASTFAGGTEGYADGTGTAAQFKLPTGMVIDSVGTLYLSLIHI